MPKEPKESKGQKAPKEPKEPKEPAVPFALDRYSKIAEQNFDELDLTDNAICDEHLKLLCDRIWETGSITSLRRLVLQRCSISRNGLDILGNFLAGGVSSGAASPLESLVLSGSDVGPEGLGASFLEGLKLGKSLRSLDLSCCSLQDEGIVSLCHVLGLRQPAVRELPRLEELALGCNRLGPEGAKTLSTCLATNMALHKLDLRANVLGADGASILAEGLQANKGRLKTLNVSQNELKLQGARVFVDSFLQRDFQYTINLMRPRGKPTGMVFDKDMVVTNISLASVVEIWNQEQPSDAVLVGDCIVKVNNDEAREEMLEELRSKEELAVTLQRRGGLTSLDLCHNMVTLSGVKDLRKLLGCPAAGDNRGWQLSLDGGERELWLTAH